MKVQALVKRILLQIIRDKRTLALLFIAPLLILTLMDFIFDVEPVNPTLGVTNLSAQTAEALHELSIDVITYDEQENIHRTMIDDELDGFLQLKDNTISLTVLNEDASVTKTLAIKIQQVMSQQPQMQANPQLQQLLNDQVISIDYVYGDAETTFFDTLSSMVIGFFVFFFVFLISGIGLLNERTTGTLDRLLATPIKRGEIITAYLIGYGLLAIIQTIIIVLFAVTVLEIPVAGSIVDVIIINVLIAFVALALGLLLSSFANSEFQMIQSIPIVTVPQIFFSGIFALDTLPIWIQSLAKLMPLYYAADALKAVMYKGESFREILPQLAILLLFAGIFICINLLVLKKYRKL